MICIIVAVSVIITIFKSLHCSYISRNYDIHYITFKLCIFFIYNLYNIFPLCFLSNKEYILEIELNQKFLISQHIERWKFLLTLFLFFTISACYMKTSKLCLLNFGLRNIVYLLQKLQNSNQKLYNLYIISYVSRNAAHQSFTIISGFLLRKTTRRQHLNA